MRLTLIFLAFYFHLTFCFSFENVSLYSTTSENREHCPLLAGLCPITNVQEETPFRELQWAETNKDVQPKTRKFLQQSGITLQANALERRAKVKTSYRPGLGKEKQLKKESVILKKESVIDQGLRVYLNNQVIQLTKNHRKYDKAQKALNAFTSEYCRILRSKGDTKRYPNWPAALVTLKAQYNRQFRRVLNAQAQFKNTHKTLLAFQGGDPGVGKHATHVIGCAAVKAATKQFHEAHSVTTPALKHAISFYHKCAGNLLRSLEKCRLDAWRAAIAVEARKQSWQAKKINGVGKRMALAEYEAARKHANKLEERYSQRYWKSMANYRAIRGIEERISHLNQALKKHYWNENKKDDFGDARLGEYTRLFEDEWRLEALQREQVELQEEVVPQRRVKGKRGQ